MKSWLDFGYKAGPTGPVQLAWATDILNAETLEITGVDYTTTNICRADFAAADAGDVVTFLNVVKINAP